MNTHVLYKSCPSPTIICLSDTNVETISENNESYIGLYNKYNMLVNHTNSKNKNNCFINKCINIKMVEKLEWVFQTTVEKRTIIKII